MLRATFLDKADASRRVLEPTPRSDIMAATSYKPMPSNSTTAHASSAIYHHRTQGKAVEGIHIRGVTDALRALGVEVDIVSMPGANPYAAPRSMSPTRQATWLMRLVSSLPEPLFEIAEMAYNVIAVARLLKTLREKPVDFIYERYSLFLLAGVLVAKWRHIPIILEVNDSAIVHRVRPLFFGACAKRVERWVFRNCQGLVFVSSAFRDRAMAAHGALAPSIVSPNAANIAQFSFTPQQRDDTRARYGLNDSIVCGYLGAFVPWHGIDAFVRRIADRLSDHPDLKLLLVGDGALYPALRDFVESRKLTERVILTGRVPHDQVPGLLAAMDLAILPNAGDYTSPVKLFEFMACGIPPVAPDLEPVREVLVEAQTGWMFEAGDIDAAVKVVFDRASEPLELRRVGMAARAYIERERQWHNNALQLLDFHRSLLDAARASIPGVGH